MNIHFYTVHYNVVMPKLFYFHLNLCKIVYSLIISDLLSRTFKIVLSRVKTDFGTSRYNFFLDVTIPAFPASGFNK